MNKYIRKNLIYPPDAKEKKVKGTVYVMVVVETDGSLSNISVVHSPDMSLSKEAGRVISSMPKWEPGMQNGHPVRVQQLIPVEFKI
jgi:protein TonB